MVRGMVVANMTEVAGIMDLAMAVSSAIMAGHLGVINSIAVIKGFFGQSMRVCRGWCTGWFGVFFFDERGRRQCVRLR
jgi:hypothetical protein